MSKLSIDIRVPVGRSLPVLADFAARCEQAGLDGVGVPDHHHTGRDAYMVLAAMAGRTERIRLYPATSNVVTRHPLVAAALDELARRACARAGGPDRGTRFPVGREGRRATGASCSGFGRSCLPCAGSSAKAMGNSMATISSSSTGRPAARA